MEKKEESVLEGKKVLIADDEPDVLETLEELLSMCKVVKASTFEEGKKQLETQSFDFAILDIMGIDGYKLLDIAVDKDITALMLTAHALTPQDTVRSFKGGAASYVPKDEISRVQLGQTARIVDDKSGFAVTGTVAEIKPDAEPHSRTFLTKIRFDNPERRFRPGMFARAVLDLETRDQALVLPKDCLKPVAGGLGVFVIRDRMKIRRIAWNFELAFFGWIHWVGQIQNV